MRNCNVVAGMIDRNLRRTGMAHYLGNEDGRNNYRRHLPLAQAYRKKDLPGYRNEVTRNPAGLLAATQVERNKQRKAITVVNL